MDDSLNTLRNFVEIIADGERDFNSLRGPVLHYAIFLRKILNAKRPSFLQQRDINTPTKISTGDALTPWHAAACMEDRIRTAAFIRGAIRAIENALEQDSQRPLHLVEAGCGPLGTLILPLLSYFNSQDLVVSVVDLHEESIKCMKSMLDHFGFLPRTRQIICGDATEVNFESPVDIILTETMNTALSHEPQVAITRALMRKHDNAILIPQTIRVDLTLVDTQTELSHFPAKVCERTVLATVFELNRNTALELEEKDGILPAASAELHNKIMADHVLCLTTRIQVFEDIQIGDYETQITPPIPLIQSGDPRLLPGIIIQFAYKMGKSPGLIWNLIDGAHSANRIA